MLPLKHTLINGVVIGVSQPVEQIRFTAENGFDVIVKEARSNSRPQTAIDCVEVYVFCLQNIVHITGLEVRSPRQEDVVVLNVKGYVIQEVAFDKQKQKYWKKSNTLTDSKNLPLLLYNSWHLYTCFQLRNPLDAKVLHLFVFVLER